jgi:CubicO group peptidase (beta-lactamase class C family)
MVVRIGGVTVEEDALLGEGNNAVPGLVAAVASSDGDDIVALGGQAIDGPEMTRHSIFRIASITKPITAAAAMLLVDDGLLDLDEPVAWFLPELAQPQVLRRPDSAIDDTVAAERPITTRHLLTFTAGHGFPADFSLPVVQLLFERLNQGPPQPQAVPPPDVWMQRLAEVPLLHQPGRGWTYNTGSDILGVLIARASGQPLPEFFQERIFDPLGMVDTGFAVAEVDLPRFTTYYQRAPGAGELSVIDEPGGQWASPPAFPSGAGGLVSTAEDWLAFGRMLLGGGEYRGRRVLSAHSVRAMTTDALGPAGLDGLSIFLEGQGWGFGGSVDLGGDDPWIEPGRYGWVGGTGTAAHVSFARGRVMVLLTQVAMTGPTAPRVMRAFWTATT